MTANTDWSVLDEDVMWVCERAAAQAAATTGADGDDLLSEALIYYATHVREMDNLRRWGERNAVSDDPVAAGCKRAARRLGQRLVEVTVRKAAAEETELDAALSVADPAVDLGRWVNRPTPPGFEEVSYTPADLEALLPVVWDDELLSERPLTETAPPMDMPRAASDPATAGGHWAMYADARVAYARAGLTLEEKQALFCLYCLGDSQRSAGRRLGVRDVTVGARSDSGLQKMLAYLNGKDIPLSGSVIDDGESLDEERMLSVYVDEAPLAS